MHEQYRLSDMIQQDTGSEKGPNFLDSASEVMVVSPFNFHAHITVLHASEFTHRVAKDATRTILCLLFSSPVLSLF